MLAQNSLEISPSLFTGVQQRLNQLRIGGKTITPAMYRAAYEGIINASLANMDRKIARATQQDQFEQNLAEEKRRTDIKAALTKDELAAQRTSGIASAVGQVGMGGLLAYKMGMFDKFLPGKKIPTIGGPPSYEAGPYVPEAATAYPDATPAIAEMPTSTVEAPGQLGFTGPSTITPNNEMAYGANLMEGGAVGANPAIAEMPNYEAGPYATKAVIPTEGLTPEIPATGLEGATTVAPELPAYEPGPFFAPEAAPAAETGTMVSGAEGAAEGTEAAAAGMSPWVPVIGGAVRTGMGLLQGEKPGKAIGAGAGAGLGMWGGAAIGSIFPGVGTIIGGIIGAIGGSIGGGFLGDIADSCIIVTCATSRESDEVMTAKEFRDTFMDKDSIRGYYMIAECVVPMMKDSAEFKERIKESFVDPLIEFGGYVLGKTDERPSEEATRTAIKFLTACKSIGMTKKRYMRATGEVY